MVGKEFDDLVQRDRAAARDDASAAARDVVATEADRAADRRDQTARRSDTTEPEDERTSAARDRSHAAADRKRARHDREDSEHDRWRAGEDRGAAHDAVSQLRGLLYRAQDDDEVMIMLGQAQGMIMAARDATPLEALLELSARAAKDGIELGAAADAIVREANESREDGR
jgi:chromatin segregation and condensation protein Rec8/ScpA/Scc1 (kleisin family)